MEEKLVAFISSQQQTNKQLEDGSMLTYAVAIHLNYENKSEFSLRFKLL
jgi:hypothetical protein